MELHQLGVGPKEGFRIEDDQAEWDDFLNEGIQLEGAKTYVKLRTQLLFDPPSNSFLVNAITDQINELQFRLLVQVEEGENWNE